MGFKRKATLIVISGFAAMIAALLLLGQLTLRWTAEAVARQEAVHTFGHAVKLLDKELDHLRLVVADWSAWDDSFDFARTGNDDYARANLLADSFENIRVSYFSIFDASDRPVALFPDTGSGDAPELSRLRSEALRAGVASGIVSRDGALHFAAAQAITRTDGSGPAAGTLIMLRPLDRTAIEEMEAFLDADLDFEIDGSIVRRGTEPILTSLGKNRHRVAGLLPSNELGTPVRMSLVPEKQIITFNRQIVSLFFLVAVAATILVTLFMLVMLDRHILRRLVRIGKELEPIESSGVHSHRVSAEGDDEIGRLGALLNKTLDSLEASFTEIERGKKQIEQSMEERESLYQEIRHRVKNNLQVVASLLNLQADEAEDPAVSELFKNARRRVLAIAFVHEELYSRESLHSIDLNEYVARLSILIRQTLDPDGGISFALDSDDLHLSVERAVPFALIVNEVLANAYQHAFPGAECRSGEKRTVAFSLKANGTGGIIAEIADNGCGLPPAQSRRKTTLGLTLIDALAAQLQADYDYAALPGGGTRFFLVFSQDGSARSLV